MARAAGHRAQGAGARLITSHGLAEEVLIRTLSLCDLPGVMEVQRSAYPDGLIEPAASFARKLEIWPEGARGAFDGDVLAGYLFCHPWPTGTVAPFGSKRIVIPTAKADLFIHDLAVRPERRGVGIASLLVREAVAMAAAHRLSRCALVAVLDARPFWERLSFRPVCEIGYGAGERGWYMVMDLPASPPLVRNGSTDPWTAAPYADDVRSQNLPYSD